jgi:carboxymethylenebutenolidase
MIHYETVTEKISLRGHNGDEIEAYFARPSAPGRYPGIVVIHHLPGWDAWTREVTRRFADAGFLALAPHLFTRIGEGTPEERAKAARATMGPPDADVMGDIAGSAAYLKEQPSSNGKVGCIGFCSGGRQAYLAASQVQEIDAAVDCWGGAVIPDDRFSQNELRPVSPFAATKDIRVPLLGIFGNDDVFPKPEEVDTIEAALQEHGKTYEFHRYDGAGHGFWANDRASYRVEQTQDSWKKTLDFLERTLT